MTMQYTIHPYTCIYNVHIYMKSLLKDLHRKSCIYMLQAYKLLATFLITLMEMYTYAYSKTQKRGHSPVRVISVSTEVE